MSSSLRGDKTLNPKDQRVDAQHNRAAILAAAHDLLSTHETVSMNAIAKKAGVANGTLYRHFSTREELILELDLDCKFARFMGGISRIAHAMREMPPMKRANLDSSDSWWPSQSAVGFRASGADNPSAGRLRGQRDGFRGRRRLADTRWR